MLIGRYRYHLHCADAETEAQRHQLSGPESPGWRMAGVGLKQGSPAPQSIISSIAPTALLVLPANHKGLSPYAAAHVLSAPVPTAIPLVPDRVMPQRVTRAY